MEIKNENVFNFGTGVWCSGLLIKNDDKLYIITKEEKIKKGDSYFKRISRNIFQLEVCNGRENINEIKKYRNGYKIIVFPEQILEEDKEQITNKINTFVLVHLYPNMCGPGQSGWLIDNDIDGESGKVKLHY